MNDARTRDLGRTASRGVAVTMGGLWTKTIVQLGSTMLLARLLDPADFGLVAMVTAIVGVADLVRDFGMTGAVIQVRELGDRLWSSVLWFSLALGVVLTAAVAASAPLIAALYDEERLVVLTLAIAPTLLVNALAMPLQARVQRELRFGVLARIDVVSMTVGAAAGIGAALADWGVWSLVVLAGAGQLVRLAELWRTAPPRFGAPRIDRGLAPLVLTGGSIFGVQLLNYAARNLDNVVIGQQLGPAALGQYSRAYSLFLLPLQQLTGPLGRVALPVLSALQDDPERYRRYVRGAVLVIGYLSIPCYALLAATAEPLVAVLLGPQWHEAALLFALLAVAGVAQAVGNVQGWLYLSLGRAHRQFVYYAVTRPIVIGGFFVGIWWAGTAGLALVYGLVTLALLVPGFALAIRGTFVRPGDVIGPLVRPVLATPAGFAAAWAAVRFVPAPAPLSLLLGLAAGVAAFAAMLAIPAYRRDLGRIVAFLEQVRRPPAGSGGTPGAAAVGTDEEPRTPSPHVHEPDPTRKAAP